MAGNRILKILSGMVLFIVACTFGGLLTPSPTSTPFLTPTSAPTEPTTRQGGDMAGALEQLGGAPCEENPDFTCVTVQVPLDHFDPANIETLGVVFAVAPASGERYGMFVQAFPGGPGGEGVSTAGLYWYDDAILEHFDLVFFDQRGLGLSGALDCPAQYAQDFLAYLNGNDSAGLEGFDTPAEQQTAIDQARAFVDGCIAEMGIDPAKLRFYGTDQVAEDIEAFRQIVGDEKFWLYGVSYGTAVAQTYAAAHPDRLAGLILDGTVNMTQTGEQGAVSQDKAFDKVLTAVLEACNADDICAAELGGDAVSAYDRLAQKLAEGPIAYEYPLPTGETVRKSFTFNQLEFTAAYQMYSIGSRMLFLRALAAADQGDMVPMARLLHIQATLDPATGDYLGDATFSDAMFFGVNCTDDAYFSGSQDERIAQTIQAGQASNGIVPRLDGGVYTGLYCAYWPSAPADVVQRPPLTAPGVPTFVLNATLDPATPFEEGKAVFEHLENGYHLYVEGGSHSIYGYGYECPDDLITDFMVNGRLPSQREIVCEWDPAVIRAYEPLMPKNVAEFGDVLEVLAAVDVELSIMPEYYYSYFTEDTTFACPFGGSFTFGPGGNGETYSFSECAFTQGFALTGTGGFDYGTSVVTLEADVSGDKTGTLTFTTDYANGQYSVTGEYGGETIHISR